MTRGAKLRSLLLWTTTWTFSFSSYSISIGAVLLGLMYFINPSWAPTSDILGFADTLWGGLLILAGAAQVYYMWTQRPRVVRRLSAVIFLFMVSLLLASVMEGRPVAVVAAVVASVYHSYMFLVAGLIIGKKRKRQKR